MAKVKGDISPSSSSCRLLSGVPLVILVQIILVHVVLQEEKAKMTAEELGLLQLEPYNLEANRIKLECLKVPQYVVNSAPYMLQLPDRFVFFLFRLEIFLSIH